MHAYRPSPCTYAFTGTNPFDDPSITNAVGQTNDFSFDQNIGMEPAPTHPPADEHQPLGLGFSSDDPMNNATVNPPAHMHAQSGASDKNGFTDNSLDFIDQVNNSGTIHDHNDNTNNNTNDPFMLGGSIDLPPQHQHRKSAYEMTGGSINPFGNAADIASSQPAYSSSSSSFEPYTVSLGPGAASGSMQGMGAMSNTMNNDPNTNNTTNDMKNSNAYEAPNLNGNMSMNNNNNMNSNSVNNNNMNVDRMSTEEEQKNAKFYQLAYYQKYFNVTTTLIGKRLLRTYVPTRAFYTPEETPDLYVLIK